MCLSLLIVKSQNSQFQVHFGHRMIEPHKLEFPKVTTLSIGSGENTKFYNVVEDPKGSPDMTDEHDDILQAFTHWTHHISDALLMIQIKPQGVEIRNSDPVIHCSDVMRFLTHKHIDTHTNLGAEGFKLFSASHDCNKVCKQLGLTPLSWEEVHYFIVFSVTCIIVSLTPKGGLFVVCMNEHECKKGYYLRH